MSNRAYHYSDVTLVPRYSEINSRSEVDTSVTFLGHTFKSCMIPANMKCVISPDLCIKLFKEGYFTILHRFLPKEEIVKYTHICNELNLPCSISIGVNEYDYYLLTNINKCAFITIDVAHGHHTKVKNMIERIRDSFGQSVKIIAGNVATRAGVTYLMESGADAVKVGIAGGKVCTTKSQTGFHIPMYSCLSDCNHRIAPIIADGGISCPGDIAKAINAGATMVMAGSLFAACEESPAKYVEQLEDPTAGIYTHWKEYYGSASFENTGIDRHIEGTSTLLKLNKQTYVQLMEEYNQHLSSACSYANVNKLINLQNRCDIKILN